MKTLIISSILLFVATNAHASSSNEEMKMCLQEHGYDYDASVEERLKFNFKLAANCHSDYRSIKQKEQDAEIKDFLKHNPRYRFPGQSLNRCFGKPREQAFESVTSTTNGDSWSVNVKYKDKMPQPCHETGPWDNRDEVQWNILLQ